MQGLISGAFGRKGGFLADGIGRADRPRSARRKRVIRIVQAAISVAVGV